MSHCSPDRDGKSKYTCYTLEDILLLIKAYNSKRSNKIVIGNKSKKQLWQELEKKMKKDCNYEWCWLEKGYLPSQDSTALKERFRTQRPREWKKNPYTWLETPDIRKLMKPYQKKYPSFLFMGPVPLDCPSKITCSLSGLDVYILIKKVGKTKLGIVYNLDPHDKVGSHWVAVYADFEKLEILYFDSYGHPPPKMIKDFMEKLAQKIITYYQEVKKKKVEVKILVNRTRFQYGHSECGMFSSEFIISQLEGVSLEKLSRERMNDRRMNQLRKIYFRPSGQAT